jgi:hypothetical protein
MTLPAAPPLPGSMLAASDDAAHLLLAAESDPEPSDPVPADAEAPDDGVAEDDDADEDEEADGDGAGAVTVSVAEGSPPEAQPASAPTATSPVTASRNFDRLLRCMVHRQPPPGDPGSVGIQGPRAHSGGRNPSSGGRT